MNQSRKNWGFPRWGSYGSDRDASRIRLCDYHGCEKKAEHPAPKSPQSKDKWWFCEEHAGEYNRNWNFFQGMRDEEAKAYAKDEQRTAKGYSKASPYGWGGSTDEQGFSKIERDAFAALELEPGAPLEEVKRNYRALAKKYHPDINKDNQEADQKFQQVTFAYEILRGRLQSFKKS